MRVDEGRNSWNLFAIKNTKTRTIVGREGGGRAVMSPGLSYVQGRRRRRRQTETYEDNTVEAMSKQKKKKKKEKKTGPLG